MNHLEISELCHRICKANPQAEAHLMVVVATLMAEPHPPEVLWEVLRERWNSMVADSELTT